MRDNRLFVPQGVLDRWLSEGRVEVQGDVMVTRPEGHRFALSSGVLFKAEVTGTPDSQGLLGKVKDVEQLATMGAEHYAESVVLGDHAYEVVEGFTGTLVRDGAAASTLAERDLLARLLGAR